MPDAAGAPVSVTRARYPFHLMLKPAGAACNLACEYCYYLGKANLYPGRARPMDEATLEQVTAAYLQANPASEVVFGWQGGEPLLMGLDFFRRACELQSRYVRPGQRARNALQTNGTLLTEEWAAFFAKQQFLVGISLDGPARLHDVHRRDTGGRPSYHRAIAGLRHLQQCGVEYNALVTVNRTNAGYPLDVCGHLTGLGFTHLQFIPIIERQSPAARKVTPWSVRPEAFGQFLCDILDYWARHDVGRVFVQQFESALGVWLGRPPSVCVFAPTCGLALAVEHNGDLYACDHYVSPEYYRGRVTPETLASLVDGEAQRAFGQAKARLSETCVQCAARPLCNGDCPRHRLRSAEDGAPISYLCPAYRRFFTHSQPVFEEMAKEVRAGRPAANVMEVLRLMPPR